MVQAMSGELDKGDLQRRWSEDVARMEGQLQVCFHPKVDGFVLQAQAVNLRIERGYGTHGGAAAGTIWVPRS